MQKFDLIQKVHVFELENLLYIDFINLAMKKIQNDQNLEKKLQEIRKQFSLNKPIEQKETDVPKILDIKEIEKQFMPRHDQKELRLDHSSSLAPVVLSQNSLYQEKAPGVPQKLKPEIPANN